MLYTTKTEGEMLDAVCYQHYGDTAAYTEMVLAANSNLAALGALLPLGTVIELPEIKQTPVKQTFILWD